jgi:hypothetical protein
VLAFALLAIAAALFVTPLKEPDRAGLIRTMAVVAMVPGIAIGIAFHHWHGDRREGKGRSVGPGLAGLVGLALVLTASPPVVQVLVFGLGAGFLLTSAFVEPPDTSEDSSDRPGSPDAS